MNFSSEFKLGLTAMAFMALLSITAITLQSCEKSEGRKYGTLQKLSHKTFGCSYYAAEFAFEGGRMKSDGKSSSYENTQEVTLDKAAFDSLQNYLGEKVVFDYKDRGFQFCEESKILTFIQVKK